MKKEYGFISIQRQTLDGWKNYLKKVAIKGRINFFGETHFIHSPEKGVWNITHEKTMKRIIANAMKIRETMTEVLD